MAKTTAKQEKKASEKPSKKANEKIKVSKTAKPTAEKNNIKAVEAIIDNVEEKIKVTEGMGIVEIPPSNEIVAEEVAQIQEAEPIVVINPKHEDDIKDITIEKKLVALYTLQLIDSQIDKIKIVRGELPLEVSDLEDEVAGLETRIENYINEIDTLNKALAEKQTAIKDSKALMKKYEEQQMKVRNNREYDAITKEIEYQDLEIQLSEKRIREYSNALDLKNAEIETAQTELKERRDELEIKKAELNDIIAETNKDEQHLLNKSKANQQYFEERLLTAYNRIRNNARNGLAVVQIERDACGGCFSKIPPQRQLDIRMHKKIIVCEYCGRILIDNDIAEKATA